jgi:hypothetical protein
LLIALKRVYIFDITSTCAAEGFHDFHRGFSMSAGKSCAPWVVPADDNSEAIGARHHTCAFLRIKMV